MAKDYVTGKKTTFGNKLVVLGSQTFKKFAFLLTVSQSAFGFQPRL